MSSYRDIAKYKKELDYVTNYFHYPVAILLCSLISNSFLTPNHITSFAIIFEISAVALILLNFDDYSILIVILLQLGWIFDLMDGMLARYKKISYYNDSIPSLKGYYYDAVSDHVLKFIILGALSYQYSLQNQNGLMIGIVVIIIHGITQTEHTLRQMIIKSKNGQSLNATVYPKINQLILLMNNFYIFYLIFIPIKRIDLLLISLGCCEFILLLKRSIQFSYSNS